MGSKNDQQQQKSRRQLAQEEKKGKRIPEVLEYGIMFCLTYPPLISSLYILGIWDSKLVGGKALEAIAGGSVSVVVDIVATTICILCFVIGNILFYVSKRYMED